MVVLGIIAVAVAVFAAFGVNLVEAKNSPTPAVICAFSITVGFSALEAFPQKVEGFLSLFVNALITLAVAAVMIVAAGVTLKLLQE